MTSTSRWTSSPRGGVVFGAYDQPGIRTDECGVFNAGGVRAAWIRHPDGNTMAITEVSE
jgi:hypothetical protein